MPRNGRPALAAPEPAPAVDDDAKPVDSDNSDGAEDGNRGAAKRGLIHRMRSSDKRDGSEAE